jgi:hypothetical protein
MKRTYSTEVNMSDYGYLFRASHIQRDVAGMTDKEQVQFFTLILQQSFEDRGTSHTIPNDLEYIARRVLKCEVSDISPNVLELFPVLQGGKRRAHMETMQALDAASMTIHSAKTEGTKAAKERVAAKKEAVAQTTKQAGYQMTPEMAEKDAQIRKTFMSLGHTVLGKTTPTKQGDLPESLMSNVPLDQIDSQIRWAVDAEGWCSRLLGKYEADGTHVNIHNWYIRYADEIQQDYFAAQRGAI